MFEYLKLRDVSIPILRVGVQHWFVMFRHRIYSVSIPILRVGVQQCETLEEVAEGLFQFPYCAWEFNQAVFPLVEDRDVSIPILRVGVQLYTLYILSICYIVSIPILRVGVQRNS